MNGLHEADHGWESVHQRLKKHQLRDAERWRLRDWDNHPNDPGWEDGTYSTCHGKLRTKVQSGDVVFDTVYPESPVGATPIIRSAFVVGDASNGVLSFSEFMFFDGEPAAGVQARMSRGHKSLGRGQVEDYMEQIEAHDAYACYPAGSKPKSIPQELWDKMLSKAGERSNCSPCGSCDSRC